MNPKTCIRKTAPMSEIGIATTGTMTERNEPRKRKITTHDDEQRLDQGVEDVVDRGVDVFGAVVGDAALQAGGQFLLDLLHLRPDALDDVDRVGVGQHEDAHENRALAGEAHLRVVILRAEDHVGDVAQPNERSVFLPHDQILEILAPMCRSVLAVRFDLDERALGAADRGEIIVGRQRLADLRRADVERGHPVRLEPDAHGKGAPAENLRPLHAGDRGQPRLDDADRGNR